MKSAADRRLFTSEKSVSESVCPAAPKRFRREFALNRVTLRGKSGGGRSRRTGGDSSRTFPFALLRAIFVLAVSLGFAAMIPSAFAQRGGAGAHAGGGHASGAHAMGGGHFGGAHFSGGFHSGVGGASGARAASGHFTGRAFSGAGAARGSFYGGMGAPARGSFSGRFASRSAAARGFTHNVFAPPPSTERGDARANGNSRAGFFGGEAGASGAMNASSAFELAQPFAADNYVWKAPPAEKANGQGTATLELLGTGRPQIGQMSTAPARYEPVNAPHPESFGAQNGRPVYTRPQQAHPPRPIVMPSRPLGPPIQAPRPILNPLPRPIFAPHPIYHALPRYHAPWQPISGPIRAVPVHFPVQPPIRFPVPPVNGPPARAVPLLGRPLPRPLISPLPGPPAFRPILAPPPKSPLFRPVVERPRGPLAIASAPGTLRMKIHGPFEGQTAHALYFHAHPCFDTIGRCGFRFGRFDGDFDFDDGFPFGFGFGFGLPFFPVTFGPFGYPAFGYFWGPNCFYAGVFEPCAFTPWGFAELQAWGPNGWGWSYLGLGNGYYSEPPQPPPAAWNAVETTPPLNAQSFTNEYYEPPLLPPVPYSEPEAGTAQNPVTDIVTTDGIAFGVTSYWLKNNQLCYVTTYNIQDCIPISRVDLQKTVNMNYQRGVKFTLTPAPPPRKDSGQ